MQPAPDVGGSIPLLSVAQADAFKCSRSIPCSTQFNATEWNTYAWALEANSNYNYAVTIKTNTYTLPGASTNNLYSSIAVDEIRNAAVFDGLVDYRHVDTESFPNKRFNCLASFAIIPGLDYQWFRLDDDDTWSYKIGTRLPINVDNSGIVITDPRTADIAPYKWARFLSHCPSKITIN